MNPRRLAARTPGVPESLALVWFRRDLRVHDHPALATAAWQYDRVVPVFCLDPALLGGRARSGPRTRFMLGCLRDLDAALRERGSALVVREGRPEREIGALAAEAGADAVLWTSDVAPYARARDERVTAALRDAGIDARPHPGNYVADVSRPRTQQGAPFTVFTPFMRAWDGLERRGLRAAPRSLEALPSRLRKGRLPSADAVGAGAGVPEPVREPGETAARAALTAFLHGRADDYAARHDHTAAGTSVLSPYLRWGCLSPREVEERAGPGAFRRQLCWRDFYAHVLLCHPETVDEEFQERYRGTLDWADDDEALQAWKQGRTGYPLVDAGMRQLARTGWMHNRARLVVGSFLTKDLQLDWRAGERHFSALLLDGEPAQNVGNWQWIASVGVDPAPYFRRLFNPTLQARKFDPDGEYIRRWAPELARVPTERVHEPWTMSVEEQHAVACVIGEDYPEPIVDHPAARREAIELYRAAGDARRA